MALFANRVRASRPPDTRTSVCGACEAARARLAISSARRRRSSGIADSDLDAPEPRGRGAVSGRRDLHGLALPAVRNAPEDPLRRPADRIARAPEFGGRSTVG